MLNIKHIIAVLFSLFLIQGCDNPFDYNIFDANTSSSKLNIKNIKRITTNNITDTIKFAVFTDPHNNYDELKDAIKSINKQANLSFVICCGDFTNWGSSDEFKWYWGQAKKIKSPIITVIGNHDYLGNGKVIYERMFGPSNYFFEIEDYNFIVFDDIVWENDNQSPDFKWLKSSFSKEKKNIVFSHIPIGSSQLLGYNDFFKNIISTENTLMVIHGHDHSNKDIVVNNTPYHIITSVENRQFALVSLYKSGYALKRIEF